VLIGTIRKLSDDYIHKLYCIIHKVMVVLIINSQNMRGRNETEN